MATKTAPETPAEPTPDPAPEPVADGATHILVLANGQTVRTSVPCATHHWQDGYLWPVLSVHEIGA